MNRTLLIPLALAVAVATLIVCKPVTLDRTVSTLDDVESFINEYPDSALIVLNKVDSSYLITRALRAKYSLLRVMALDKCYEPIIKPGLLDHAVNWYGHRGSVDDRMKTLYYQGRVAQDNGDQKSAAIFYAQAEEYAESVTDKHALGLLYVAESSVFNSVYNYEKEKDYIEKALAVFRETGDPSLCWGIWRWSIIRLKNGILQIRCILMGLPIPTHILLRSLSISQTMLKCWFSNRTKTRKRLFRC